MINKNIKRLISIGRSCGVKYDEINDMVTYGSVKVNMSTLRDVYLFLKDYDEVFKEVIIYEQYERGYYRDGTKIT